MIYLTGDTHIPIDIAKLNTKNFPEQKNLTRRDIVIVLGDFGLYWRDDKEHRYWYDWLQEKPFTTCWVDGNHENFDWIARLPVTEDWHGGKAQVDGSIIHLMRGERYKLEGKHFLVFGGADSIDKAFRKPYISWWPQEDASMAEKFHGLENAHAPIDYVLTHTCPGSIASSMFHIPPVEEPMSKYLNKLEEELPKIKGWYFGHWHADRDYGIYHCLYDRIVRLE